MSGQNDSGAQPLALVNKIKRWDYDKSVAKMRPLLREWKRSTEEAFRELYLAREFLTGQTGQYKDPLAKNYLLHSWKSYCEELGLSCQTVNNWLRPFVPRELSETNKDTLQLAPPAKTETAAGRALRQARINEALRTNNRPSGWTDDDEAELKKQLENARLIEQAEKYNAPTYYKANDYFNDALKREKNITNFKLESNAQIHAQYKLFKYVEGYLEAFEDPETKARAAFNLALKARNLANEIAEFNFSLSQPAECIDMGQRGKRVKKIEEDLKNNLRLKIEFFNNNGCFSFGMDTVIGNGGVGSPPKGKFKSLEEAERAALAAIYDRHKDPAQQALIKKFEFVKRMKLRPFMPRQEGAGK